MKLPAQLFLRFFRWFCHPELLKYIEGDLMELYDERLKSIGKRKADIKFIIDVLLLFRPGIIRPAQGYKNLNNCAMYKSYFKIGWRNLLRNKGYSTINIAGLAMGMAVAILIGLWMYDELSFDTYHPNHSRIAQVMQHENFNGTISTKVFNPAVMGEEIRNVYGADFKYVLQSTFNYDQTLAYGDKIFLKPGRFFEPGVTEMLSLKMISGSRDGLKNMNSILLSESVARAYFGEDDPINKTLRIDNRADVNVTGVYEDLPDNTSFKNMKFILPWDLYLSLNPWIGEKKNPWGSNFTQTFVQIADHANMDQVSARIIGTLVVYKQIDHGQNRPMGYDTDGLSSVSINEERHKHFEVIRTELKNTGAIVEMAESGSPTTAVWNTSLGFDWEGKDPNQAVDFPNNPVSHDYGKTIGWEIKEGRDFSRDFASDSSAFILNESAVEFIGLKEPIGKVILWEGRPCTIIGVVKDLLVQSPYQPVRPSLFHLSTNSQNVFLLKINPDISTRDALAKIETVFKKYNPSSPFQAALQTKNSPENSGTKNALVDWLRSLLSWPSSFRV